MGKRDLAVAVIADDLSGGADCGVAFAQAGLDVAIELDRRAVPPPWARVAVVTTDSRDEGPGEARAAVAEAVTALARCRPALWYKKIDSTLRGHLALELAATIRGVRPDLSLVAPAFPAHGRTTAGGHGFLNGVPLDRTETWRAQGIDGTADLLAMLRADGLRVRGLSLEDIRAGRVARRLASVAGLSDVVVCDAETEDDLTAIAAGGLASGLNVLWAGSAGLARHLAPNLAGGGPPAEGAPAAGGDAGGAPVSAGGLAGEGARRPVAIVVGSAAGAAAGQLRALESRPGTRVVRVRPAAVLSAAGTGATAAAGVTATATAEAAAEVAAAGREIGEALARGQDVALGFVPPDSRDGFRLDTRTSRALSRALGQIIGRHDDMTGGLVLTGGDTAMAVLRACGVTTLRALGEVVTGVPVLARPDGRLTVTKAGAFGDDKVLALAADLLAAGVPAPALRKGKVRVSVSDQAGGSGRQASRPLVAITMGDPAGIGPEIIVKALSDPAVAGICRTVVIGDAGRLEQAAVTTDVKLKIVRVAEPEQAQGNPGTADCVDLNLVPRDLPWGKLSEVGGETAYQAVRRAAALAVERRVDAICTAPLNKEALHLAGHIYPGHTEMLADLTGTDEVSMMLVSPRVRVIHVTTHIGLIDMVERIEPGLVHRTIKRGHEALVRAGMPNPRIAVCGINPHAGEHGLFGRGEEEEKVQPGVERARADGIDAQGPLPADTVFFRAGRGDFDLVVAMYHDQGHGPVKVLGLEAGVNITVGLPVIRTSVDHGTAFDIAGTGKADHLSLIEALRQAAQLAAARD